MLRHIRATGCALPQQCSSQSSMARPGTDTLGYAAARRCCLTARHDAVHPPPAVRMSEPRCVVQLCTVRNVRSPPAPLIAATTPPMSCGALLCHVMTRTPAVAVASAHLTQLSGWCCVACSPASKSCASPHLACSLHNDRLRSSLARFQTPGTSELAEQAAASSVQHRRPRWNEHSHAMTPQVSSANTNLFSSCCVLCVCGLQARNERTAVVATATTGTTKAVPSQ